jgi:hypothetical protein
VAVLKNGEGAIAVEPVIAWPINATSPTRVRAPTLQKSVSQLSTGERPRLALAGSASLS